MKFYKNCNNLSEIGRVNAEGRWSKFSDSERKLYEDDRHEILNETDRDKVFADIYAWLNVHLA